MSLKLPPMNLEGSRERCRSGRFSCKTRACPLMSCLPKMFSGLFLSPHTPRHPPHPLSRWPHVLLCRADSVRFYIWCPSPSGNISRSIIPFFLPLQPLSQPLPSCWFVNMLQSLPFPKPVLDCTFFSTSCPAMLFLVPGMLQRAGHPHGFHFLPFLTLQPSSLLLSCSPHSSRSALLAVQIWPAHLLWSFPGFAGLLG